MLHSHPHLHPPPLSLSTASQLSRAGADGRMGYGAFLDHNSSNSGTPHRTQTLSLAPPLHSKSPPDLFPTFGDFLPRLDEIQQGGSGGRSRGVREKKERESWLDEGETPMGLGLNFGEEELQRGGGGGRTPLVGNKGVGELGLTPPLFNFHHSNVSDQEDSFTFFCPSDSFPSSTADSRSHSHSAPTTQATSHSFLPSSPSPPAPHHFFNTTSNLPLTPPHTPPHPLHSSISFSGPPQLPPTSTPPYPLSTQDTTLIASLHNGRTPSLAQLAPPTNENGSAMAGGRGGQLPIVNTGNQGPMVVQQGDWNCGACGFVNWRRRKICLRCFPYANDIGNVLTINSQRAASLAQNSAIPPPPPHHQQQQPQHQHQHQQHIFPPPFSHVRPPSSTSLPQVPLPAPPLSRPQSHAAPSRPPFFHHSSAPQLGFEGRLARQERGGGLPAVIWNEAPRGVGEAILRAGGGGGGFGGY